ncbi:hypothetical protein DQ239_08655 [Blastococcus sp. TF02-09]|uniref:hypothetical protein n=1 Tax=Blastococcus sp. TF02-09 TaxID=2250576 RepID=UPI000DE9BA20|nr:hypothetical protein [Blastococcus sp. TF02-9]RBY78601.1 hypothetical protein DQ239_08655 [Blastococcus sp. TF02-9]
MTAPLPTVGMTDGADQNSGDLRGDYRLLSVAEIQQVLRELQSRGPRPDTAGIAAPSPRPRKGSSQRPASTSESVPAARRPRRAEASPPVRGRSGTEGEGPARGTARAAGIRHPEAHGVELEAGWIKIVAAHAGAGASTVALAISDAAAADGQRIHLVDTAHPFRSGLVAAASEELGTDVTGAWRRGLRAGVTIDRRATDTASGDWPVPPVSDSPPLTVVDVGLAAPQNLTRLAGRSRAVVVCRPTVPGVRLTEQLLEQLGTRSVVVAAVGPRRWSGEVTGSLGPRLLALRAAGRVVPVPMDRRLQVTGPTSPPLPKPLRGAGRALLELLDDGPHRAATEAPTATDPVPTPEDTRR